MSMDMDLQQETPSGFKRDLSQRAQWARLRRELETRRIPRGSWRIHGYRLIRQLLELADVGLRPRFMRPFTASAYQPQLTERELRFANLPHAFDGYRVLHLSDMHFDRVPGLEHVVTEMIRDLPLDLAVFTGDYQDRRSRPGAEMESKILRPMRTICEAIRPRDGILATLGNHDSIQLMEPFESVGVHVLGNETLQLHRGDQWIHVTGVDDVHRYYTPMAREALRADHQGFKIALVHSADLYQEAAQNGYALQLSGHTHGGQICLPGGVPLFTNLTAGRRFASGMWQHEQLIGITNRGVGVAGLRFRLFCPGEVVVITLRRSIANL